jgi:DNA (cytosine-5)-methyltransferase 3A
MNVLSLFDGISCGRVALDRAGIEVNAYMASEIEKNAIKISDKNYPDIIRVGSVVGLEVEGQIDLLIGGSPCQDLSIAKKDRKGLEGDRSGLFWEYLRIKKECNPQWFVLENVASMPKADRDIITREMGVEPVMFNASLVSAQSRKRLFWTNIPFDLPVDRGILLKDILEADVDEKFYFNGKIGSSQANRVRDFSGKSVTLSAHGGGAGAKTGLYKVGRDIGRRLVDGHRADADTSIPYERRIETREDDKSGTLTSVAKDNLVVGDRIRKLTPIECERLQGLPDNYTEGVATTHRYKCLGNAFNVDVVAHILGRVKLMYSS